MKRKEKRGAIGVLLRWAKMLKKKAQEELKRKLEEIKGRVKEQERRISDLEKTLLQVIYELKSMLEENLVESESKFNSLLELDKSLISEKKKKGKDLFPS